MSALSIYTAMTEMALVLIDYVGSAENISLPNKPYAPPPSYTGVWYELEIEHDAMGQGSLADHQGKKLYDRLGQVVITIYTQAGTGSELATNTAEAIIDRYNAASTTSDIWFRNATLRQEVTASKAVPLWYQVSVVVEFEYTQIK